jgi:circadian clock protein KaiB
LDKAEPKYLLRLYVSGMSPRSTRAILNLKSFCKEHLNDQYVLDVIDIYQQPALAKREDIVAAPTLIKHLPAPLRRFIGDMSNTERLLVGLNLVPLNEEREENEQRDGHDHVPRF